jgi:glycerol-3-phosphate dehydrogenase (NAD(P)+)
MARETVAVIGGGAWGLALAAAAARTGADTIVHSRRALNDALPKGVAQASSLAEVGAKAKLIVLAVPSEHVHAVARSLAEHVDGRHYVVHGTRGLVAVKDSVELETVSDIVRRETPARRVGALGGPALDEDLLAGRPSALVGGSAFPEVNDAMSRAFTSKTLRLYTTADLRGLEWASALVGCVMVGLGYAQSAGLSPGLIATFISRAVSESAKIAAAAGGEERTLFGLAGYGDLLASVAQTERPEIVLGNLLGKGLPLVDALKSTAVRIEAVELIARLATWVDAHSVNAPLFRALASGVLTSRATSELIGELMTLPVLDRG